jgi:ketosteroid isomerase-like protein
MKKVLFLLAAIAVIASCNNHPDTPVAGTNETGEGANHEKSTENIKTVYRAIETGDVSKLDSFIAEDFVDHNGNPDGSDIKGRDSVKKMLSQIHTYFEDGLKMDFISDALSSDGNYHYATVRMKGKAKANPWGMPVGSDVDDTSVDVVKLKDGMATEHWGFMSMGDMNEMMKMMQPGAPPKEKKTN